ncbi:Uncharacterised protein [Bacteroides uniformis]|uniref:Transmembrane protein n=1 Tax=Bacteroides uniformis TaxID=820 RepID=A0A174VA51_BACUN|nr:Uncharacterised protein [Bacteroides uniformis]
MATATPLSNSNVAGISISLFLATLSYLTWLYTPSCVFTYPGRYMSNAIGFPCKLNCVLSSYITYESHAFCSGNSYLNAIPSSNALTTRFIRRPESDRSCMGTVISLQRLRTLLVLPTMSLYVSSIFLRCTFPALRFLPNSPLSKLKPSKEFVIRGCFL